MKTRRTRTKTIILWTYDRWGKIIDEVMSEGVKELEWTFCKDSCRKKCEQDKKCPHGKPKMVGRKDKQEELFKKCKKREIEVTVKVKD